MIRVLGIDLSGLAGPSRRATIFGWRAVGRPAVLLGLLIGTAASVWVACTPTPRTVALPTGEGSTPGPVDAEPSTTSPSVQGGVQGPDEPYRQWSKVELTFAGSSMQGLNPTSNPFLIDVTVTFTGPDGSAYEIPAFYDGDGAGGMDGNIWRARFSPPLAGPWSYTTHSDEPALDEQQGSFEVEEPASCPDYFAGGLPTFACVGRLLPVAGPYLRFEAGLYWLKGGIDDPEDFLAAGQTAGFESKIAAVDYLASVGVNSVYIMLMNIGGDGRNVWPWHGQDERQAMQHTEHFDIAKLAEWELLFDHIQAKGIVLHLVLEDDSGWTQFDRSLYYREIVARFAHHNAIVWNLSEEFNENYSPAEVGDFADQLRALDAYHHPVTVHHAGGLRAWQPFVGDTRFDLTSLQTGRHPSNADAVGWYRMLAESRHPIALSFDETGKIGSNDRALSRHIVWSIYMGGGNFEIHTSPLRDYRDFGLHLQDLARARAIIEQHPFWEMRPHNELIVRGEGYVLAKPGEVYLVYLPEGGVLDLDLSTSSASFSALWIDPATGERQVISAEDRAFSQWTAPFEADAVLVVTRLP